MNGAGRSASRWGVLWCALVVFLVLLAPVAMAAPVGAVAPAGGGRAAGFVTLATVEQADRLQMDFEVQADGSVVVTESITWRFPEGEERHGILRNVQVRAGYQDQEDAYRYFELSEVAVTSPSGAPTDISISDFGAYRQIRIGSPSLTVSGTADYIVTYRLQHIVNDIGDGTAEFYYDMVDTSNDFPQQNVSATVTGPVAATRAACYYGELGSTDQCTATPGETATFEVPDLAPREGASIITSYPRDAFGDLTPDVRQGDPASGASSPVSPRVSRALAWLTTGLGVLLPVLAGALMGLLVWRRGRDEQFAGVTPGLSPGHGDQRTVVNGGPRPTVAVQFNPPPGVQPGMLGTVLDEEANVLDVSATIVDLAVRGHLSIGREDKGVFRADDWLLTRLTPPATAAPLVPYEQTLVDALFASGNQVALSQLKNTFKPTLDAVQRMMYEEVVQRGWFRRSPQSQRSGWMALGLVIAGLSVFLGFVASGPLLRALRRLRLRRPPDLHPGGRRRHRRTHHPHPGQADGVAHRAGVSRPDPVPGVPAVHRHRRGEPDQVGGGAGRLQPLPALRHRLRPGRPVGRGVRGGRDRSGCRRARRRGAGLVLGELEFQRVR